jgi:hypothetical protein
MTLELFEKHPTLDAYRVGPSYTPYSFIAQDKRFTDAELAAEYWAVEAKARSLKLTSRSLELQEQAATFQRFAQHSHYDTIT